MPNASSLGVRGSRVRPTLPMRDGPAARLSRTAPRPHPSAHDHRPHTPHRPPGPARALRGSAPDRARRRRSPGAQAGVLLLVGGRPQARRARVHALAPPPQGLGPPFAQRAARRASRRHRGTRARPGARKRPSAKTARPPRARAGSPPACTDGSEPELQRRSLARSTNASGAILYCVPSGEPGTPFGEACAAEQHSAQTCAGAGASGQRLSPCADGSAAALNGEGSYLCGRLQRTALPRRLRPDALRKRHDARLRTGRSDA